MPTILGANTLSTGYDVANSLRFNDDDSAYLNKTFSSAGNRRTFTYSCWLKRGNLDNSSTYNMRFFGSTDSLQFWVNPNTVGKLNINIASGELTTNRVFKDPSAWFHVVLAVDTTQSTDSNRLKLYINGTQETSFSTETYPSLNAESSINNNVEHSIGRQLSTSRYYDGYMSECIFVDGQALAPTQFGETDSNGVWVPKNYTGTYGTNGFKLDFADASDLGDDESGNGNDFTENNLTSVDKVSDTPQNNSCTFNPLYRTTSEINNGNLVYNSPSSNPVFGSITTFGVNSGKWYAEVKYEAGANHYGIIGICDEVFTTLSDLGSATNTDFGKTGPALGSHPQYCTIAYVINTGAYRNNNTNTSWGSAGGDGDIINIALDRTNRKVYFGVNGTYGNSSNPATGTNGIDLSSLITGDTYFLGVTNDTGSSETILDFNFGAGFGKYTVSSSNSDANGHGNFEYAVPSGYYAWNTKNLAEFG